MFGIAFVMTIFATQMPQNETFNKFVNLAVIESFAGQETTPEVVKCYCVDNWTKPNVCSASGDGAYCGGDPCSNHDGNCRD